MQKHKWYNEIVAWAMGAEIECRHPTSVGAFGNGKDWVTTANPSWVEGIEYRVKPQPKEPQYLYCFIQSGDDTVRTSLSMLPRYKNDMLIGKIKLEVDDDNN